MAFGPLDVVACESNTATQPISRENVGSDSIGKSTKPTKDTKAKDTSDTDEQDPDVINAREAAAEAAEVAAKKAAASEKAKADEKSGDKTNELDPSFAGLDTRLAHAISAEPGIATRTDLEAWIASGKDLIDIDGIGPKTKPKVLEWLATPAA